MCEVAILAQSKITAGKRQQQASRNESCHDSPFVSIAVRIEVVKVQYFGSHQENVYVESEGVAMQIGRMMLEPMTNLQVCQSQPLEVRLLHTCLRCIFCKKPKSSLAGKINIRHSRPFSGKHAGLCPI